MVTAGHHLRMALRAKNKHIQNYRDINLIMARLSWRRYRTRSFEKLWHCRRSIILDLNGRYPYQYCWRSSHLRRVLEALVHVPVSPALCDVEHTSLKCWRLCHYRNVLFLRGECLNVYVPDDGDV